MHILVKSCDDIYFFKTFCRGAHSDVAHWKHLKTRLMNYKIQNKIRYNYLSLVSTFLTLCKVMLFLVNCRHVAVQLV